MARQNFAQGPNPTTDAATSKQINGRTGDLLLCVERRSQECLAVFFGTEKTRKMISKERACIASWATNGCPMGHPAAASVAIACMVEETGLPDGHGNEA